MVALGHAERVLRSREIWYCLQCQRCTSACPSAVAPATHVRAWRAEAVRRGFVDLPTLERYEALCRQLQRARARLVAECVLGDRPLRDAAAEWRSLAPPDATHRAARARLDTSAAHRALDDDLESSLGVPAALNACMSCRECMTVCPVAGDGAVYDPVRLFRMVRLGLAEELLTAPAIWLCLGCGRCTSACTQGVSGHRLLASLQELAIRRGLVPADVRERLGALDRELYPRFVEAVERL
jgi:heterodisulfide reductase subunit C